MGVIDATGNMSAGVVFHDWNPERGLIEVSCAAVDRRWMTRRVVGEVMGYGFTVARVITTRTAESNRTVRRIWRALNATEYALAGLWGPDEAMMVYTMTPAQWRTSRLYGGRNGQA